MRHIGPISVFGKGGTDILQEHQETQQCPEPCTFIHPSHQPTNPTTFWTLFALEFPALLPIFQPAGACLMMFMDVYGMASIQWEEKKI